MFRKLLLTALLFAAFIPGVSAQLYTIKSYTDDSGLAQNYVYSLSQDENGFLLIGTGEGLNSFDGDHFRTYTVKDGMAENFVTAHLTTGSKTYIGHFQGGVSILSNRKFTRIKDKELEGVKINGFLRDKNSNTFLYTQGKGLYRIDNDKKLISYPNPLANGINHMEADHANDFLFATNDGLLVLQYESPLQYKEISSPDELKYKTISRIARGNKQGTLFWVGVEGEGLYSIFKEGGRYVVKTFISAEQLGVTDFRMTSMIRDNEGNLWLGFLGDGVRKLIFTGSDKNTWLVKKIDAANGLENLNIQQIFQDREGNILFGTFGGGLFLKTIQPYMYYNAGNGLLHFNIKSVAASDQNMLWIGHEKGIYSYNLTTNAVKSFGKSNGFTDDEVNCIKKGANGILWIGTRTNGVFTYDPAAGKFTHFSKEHKLKLNCVNSIEQTAYGVVYIGTTDGLYICNNKTKAVSFLTTIEGLMHNNVRHLFLDGQNRLWIASPGSPPYYYSNGKFSAFKEIEGLRNYKITSYAEDRSGSIWIATEGDGVFRYSNGRFTNFTIRENLKSNYVYGAVYDGLETVWFTHKNGLSKLNITTGKISGVDKNHGNLRFLENNFNSFCREDNLLFFGTTRGLVFYNSNLNSNSKLAITSIRDIVFDERPHAGLSNISLPYKRYNVTIRFKGILFSDQKNVHYKYRLIGLDDSWHTTTNDFVDYPKLDEGTYTFELLSCNPQGLWTTKPVSVTFTIAAPYWKTWWFYLLIASLLFAIVWFVFRIRLKTLNDVRMKLESVVAYKTRELVEEKNVIEVIKNELEEKNKDITDSINYALGIQRAILPDDKTIYGRFPDSTIFYRPRDIVSGDFYWFYETEEYAYYSVIDCTGHGIPGAFMSLIGSTLMNEIIRDHKVTSPAGILQLLHNLIIQTLKQDSGNLSRDGMDMVLCRFDKNSEKLTFSSAGRPLYHVRKGRLNAYRGGAFSIGGSYDYLQTNFLDQEISLEKGDLIALFSDGYPDQFGGAPLNKKFSAKRVKELCTRIAGKSREERDELIRRSFLDWKGDSEQIDDVLFISIKV